MPALQQITPCLWFDSQAEQAAEYYCSVFPNSRIKEVNRFGEAGKEIHGKEPGSVMSVTYELNGNPFMALNGGPMFQLNEAVSFQIYCETQEEVDHYWNRLTEGADPDAQQCGWLKDRFGLSWQVIPNAFMEMMADSDPAKVERVTNAMLEMKKLDIAGLRAAFEATA